MARHPSILRAVLAGACLAGAARAQIPERVLDIGNAVVPNSVGAVEHELVVLGNYAYYGGFGAATGVELYRADVTRTDVQLLKDVHPGRPGSFPFAFAATATKVFCMAADPVHGYELWSSDGTTTALVKDVYTGISSSMIPDDRIRSGIGVLNGSLFFGAEDGFDNYALWRSDGTAAGTTLVKKLGSFRGRTPLLQFVTVGSFGLFLAPNQIVNSIDLWQTDGTPAGTRLLSPLVPTPGTRLRRSFKLTVAGNAVYATGAGTVIHVVPGATSSQVTTLLSSSAILHSGFGSITDPQKQKEIFLFSGGASLWRSDGTPNGTVPYYPRTGIGVLNAVEQEPAVLGNRMVFFGFDLHHGEEPWVTDGTANGTVMLRDLRVGPLDSTPSSGFGSERQVVTDGIRAYFAADDGVNGLELWVTDGTTSGTRLVDDINPGIAGSVPRSLHPLPQGGVVFVADHGTGAGLWVFDAVSLQVRCIADNFDSYRCRTTPSRVSGLVAHDGLLYFAADDGATGSELWCSDGTAGGTSLVRDLLAGPGSGLRHHDLINGPEFGSLDAIGFEGHLYFNGYDSPRNLAMFRTDGTSAGTSKIRDLDLIAGNGWGLRGASVGQNLFFHGYDAAIGEGLFVLPASSNNTTLLAHVQPGRYHELGGKLLFTDGMPPALGAVWVSDGTPVGTFPLLQFPRFVGGPFSFARVNRSAFFAVMQQGGELWRTDGTPAGTVRVRSAAIRGLVSRDGQLYSLEEAGNGVDLIRGDGTLAGSTVVATGLPRSSQTPVVVGRRIFFVAYTGLDAELWSSDGTTPGTSLTARFPALGGDASRLVDLQAIGTRRLIFRVESTHGIGTELWQSDGTLAGTVPIDDIHRGPGGDNGAEATLVHGTVFFRADDGRSGSIDGDLWKLNPGAVVEPGVAGCAANGFVPRVFAQDPALGTNIDIELEGEPSKPGLLLLGIPLCPALQLPNGCQIHPDPVSAITVAMATDPSGRWALRGVAVPNLPNLTGVRVAVQAALASAPTMPFAADFSDSVLLVAGR